MDKKILENTLDNAWLALAEQYQKSPDEKTRQAMNLLKSLVGKVKSELFAIEERERHKHEMSVDKWIEWLLREDDD